MRCLLVLLALFTCSLHAQSVVIPGGRFSPKNAQGGQPFAEKGWQVRGTATWLGEPASPARGVRLAPSARLTREFELPDLDPAVAPKQQVDATKWWALLCAEWECEGAPTLRLRLHRGLASEWENASAKWETDTARVATPGLLTISARASDLPEGTYTLSLEAAGDRDVVIRDLSFLRLPIATDQIQYAKPNGVDGPDLLDSGALGFTAWSAHLHAPLPIHAVRENGPAALAGLRTGDIILAVDGTTLKRNSCKPGFDWFEFGHEATLGRAVAQAHANKSATVRLYALRDGVPTEATLRLRPTEAIGENFPFDSTFTPKFYDTLLKRVRDTQRPDGSWSENGIDWIQSCFAGLALLGRGDAADIPRIRRTAEWFLRKFESPEDYGNLGFWAASYTGIFLTEYWFASRDPRVRPLIEASLRWVEDGFHTSKWGTACLGHGPSGLPYEQKALMAPASHLIVFEALAQKAGFQSRIWETLLPYMIHSWSDPNKDKGHGAMGYNGSYRDQEEFWSRTGLFALAAHLRDEQPRMKTAMSHVMGARHPWMRNSHAYGNPGDVWGLIGLAQVDPTTFAHVMDAWRWAFIGAFEPGFGLRVSTAHMGAPYMGEEGLMNPAVATLLSVTRTGLVITGRDPNADPWIKSAAPTAHDSRIRAAQSSEGLYSLNAVLPPSKIHYTLDGSVPTQKSPTYTKPLSLPDGGLIRAAARLSPTQLGKTTDLAIGLPKHRWNIAFAEGDRLPEEAIRRAAALIDTDPKNPWQPDTGEGAQKLPLAVTIDLGEAQVFTGVTFRGAHSPKRIRLGLGEDAESARTSVQPFEFAQKKDRTASLPGLMKARFLHLVVEEMHADQPIRIGELDLEWPGFRLVKERGGTTIEPESTELSARFTKSSTGPTRNSPRLPPSYQLAPNECLRVRYFTSKGEPVGPIHLLF
jgi:hypothetical protein